MGKPAASELGECLRSSRVAAQLTQSALAEAVGASRAHVCQVELGKTWPSADFLRRCEEVLACPGRLTSLLRHAKVPGLSQQQHLDVVVHRFIPMVIDGEPVGLATPSRMEDHYGMVVPTYPVSSPDSRCSISVFPFGVGVLHVAEERRFPNITALALWRRSAHQNGGPWARSLVQAHPLAAGGVVVHEPDYTLTALEVRSTPWPKEQVETAMSLLSTPSVLLDRDDAYAFDSVASAERAEQDLLAHGFRHEDIVDFGVQGLSLGRASWAGLSFLALAPSRCLHVREIIRWEVLIQALWCYCHHVVHRGYEIHPFAHAERWGARFLRSTAARLSTASAREHMQQRLMKDAVLITSRLESMLDRAQDVLRDLEAAEGAR